MKKFWGLLALVAGVLYGGEVFQERFFYLGLNAAHMNDQKYQELEQVVRRVAQAGYTHVLWASPSFHANCWQMGSRHDANTVKIAEIIRKNKLKLVPSVLGACDPCQYAFVNQNVVEALPVIDEPYKVVNRKLVAENIMVNGSFEDDFKNWRVDRNVPVTLDLNCKKSGSKALHVKVDKSSQAPGGMVRIWQEVAAKPFQQYCVSFQLKTRNLTSKAWNFGIQIVPLSRDPEQKDGFRYLNYRKLYPRIKATQDWTRHYLYFNTREFSKILFAIGSWNTKTGEYWIDDIQLKPANFLNVLQRPDAPVVLKSQNGKKVYREGRDYWKFRDPELGKWSVNDHHSTPVYQLPAGTTIPENSIVLASYYHPAFALKGVNCCPHSPEFRQAAVEQIRYLQKLVRPEGFLICIDEQRAYGYDPLCVKSGMNAGEALRDLAIYTYRTIKKHAPQAVIYMWDDMFNPHGNAGFKGEKSSYYLIRGKDALAESWVGLPKDIVVMLWQAERPALLVKMIEFYRQQNMKYICYPGYFEAYDTYPHQNVLKMLNILKTDPRCQGVGFAQWAGVSGNVHLEKFSRSVKQIHK